MSVRTFRPIGSPVEPLVMTAVGELLEDRVVDLVAPELGVDPDWLRSSLQVTVALDLDSALWRWEVEVAGARRTVAFPADLVAYERERHHWGARVLGAMHAFAFELADYLRMCKARRCQQAPEACKAPRCATHCPPN